MVFMSILHFEKRAVNMFSYVIYGPLPEPVPFYQLAKY